MSDETEMPPDEDLGALLKVRREKMESLRELGIDPFGKGYPTTHSPGPLRAHFTEGEAVRLAGRITALRDMGKSNFLDISDINGRIQIFVNQKQIGEEQWAAYKQLDIGDWIGVSGETFLTKVGEPSVKADEITVLSKSLRPMPSKWHGVVDPQIKYRQRYLDLIANERSREIFKKRCLMVAEIRRYLQERDFFEVETPMLQDVPGGAAAQPFETRHNALGMDMFLRIAPELYLKRLLVGGFDKVFELNRSFRNEGISRRHNPEFTMLEAYWAYADFEQMADLVEDLICHLAEKYCGGLLIEHRDAEGNVTKTIDLSRPWKRAPYRDLVAGAAGPDWWDLTPAQRRDRCGELGVEISADMEDYEVSQQVFEKLVEEKAINPVFVTHVSKELVPLAKQNAGDDSLVDVYELIINGAEISPGYSELNDPDVQRRRLEEQAGEEIQKIDEDFLLALEYGMPPAGGIGIGIDRLIMMLTGAESIRDVVLFPQLKRKEA
ncbi:MAG: lysine--tRNA ligase [Verrucomicrobiaceae bacterium]|nr:lysine--tRNA ligase [Verrucomicrobiaceae bacterium]